MQKLFVVADFSPFIHPGIISLDACTVVSHRVNCFVIDLNEEIEKIASGS